MIIKKRATLILYIDWFIFFFKQKTAYEMRISDWSSDVCSSDLKRARLPRPAVRHAQIALGRERTGLDLAEADRERSEERRVGTSASVRVDLGGRRIIKKKNKRTLRRSYSTDNETHQRDLNTYSPSFTESHCLVSCGRSFY